MGTAEGYDGRNAAQQQERNVSVEGDIPDLPISEDGVRICWKQFATTLPKEQAAMASRLTILRPVLQEHIVKVVVDNRMVADDLIAMRSQMEIYLRQQLQNRQLRIDVVVEETQKIHQIYSRVEQFQLLEERYPVLTKLKMALDLDLS